MMKRNLNPNYQHLRHTLIDELDKEPYYDHPIQNMDSYDVDQNYSVENELSSTRRNEPILTRSNGPNYSVSNEPNECKLCEIYYKQHRHILFIMYIIIAFLCTLCLLLINKILHKPKST